MKIMVYYKDLILWVLFFYRNMPPKRRRVPAQAPEVDLAAQLNELRQMMIAQQQEIGGLRAQIAQQNQGQPAQAPQPAAPEIPEDEPMAPEHPEVPEEPIAPAVAPPAPAFRTIAELYNQFRRMKAPEFEGSSDPIEADNWLVDLQVILNFLELEDREKVLFFAQEGCPSLVGDCTDAT